jgi:hypothetical protein
MVRRHEIQLEIGLPLLGARPPSASGADIGDDDIQAFESFGSLGHKGAQRRAVPNVHSLSEHARSSGGKLGSRLVDGLNGSGAEGYGASLRRQPIRAGPTNAPGGAGDQGALSLKLKIHN